MTNYQSIPTDTKYAAGHDIPDRPAAASGAGGFFSRKALFVGTALLVIAAGAAVAVVKVRDNHSNNNKGTASAPQVASEGVRGDEPRVDDFDTPSPPKVGVDVEDATTPPPAPATTNSKRKKVSPSSSSGGSGSTGSTGSTRACLFDECFGLGVNCDKQAAQYVCLKHNGGPHGGCSPTEWTSDSCDDSCDVSQCDGLAVPESTASCEGVACTEDWCKGGQLCGPDVPYQCTDGPGRYGCSDDVFHWIQHGCPSCCDTKSCP